jgi:ribosomal protein S18 acetylase RimI-like enzyme
VLALAYSSQGDQGIIAAALANGNDARYHLVAADLRCTAQLDTAVKTAAMDVTLPTLTCIECVLCYLQPHEAAAVLAWAAATFTRGSIVTHEPTAPLHAVDAYGSALAAAFTAQGCPIACPTGGAVGQCQRLYAAGWQHAAAVTARTAAARWLAPAERARVAQLEPFDEIAALAAVQERYAVAIASHSANTLQQLCEQTVATSTDDTERSQRLSDELTLLETRAAALEAVLQQRRTTAIRAANGVTLQWLDSWQSSSSDDAESTVTAIRELFKQGLSGVAQQYSAVRKFIKSVLNSDLGTGKDGLLHCYAYANSAAVVPGQQQRPAARMLLALATAQQPLDYNADSSSSTAANSSSQQVIIGCAAVEHKGSGLVELKRMSVAPQWRSCGIGSALLSECENCARSEMAATQVVLTTLASLTAARRMYITHGFAAASKTDLGQGLYAYEYSKTLTLQH